MTQDTLESQDIDKIFLCLFGRYPDEELKSYYKKISAYVIATYPESQKRDADKILKRNGMSLLLTEFAFRIHSKKHLLCMLFKLMIHTVETRPGYRHLILNQCINSKKFIIFIKTFIIGLSSFFILLTVIPILIFHKVLK